MSALEGVPVMVRSSVDVRRAEVGDVDLLLRLVDRACLEEHLPVRPHSEAHHSRVLKALDRDDVTVFVACSGLEPVGAVVLRAAELVPLSGQDAVHIEHLFVDPDWRRRGVAHLLLSAAATATEQLGAPDLVCATAPGDREAQRFLARLGFAPLVVHRTISTASLRRRLSGHGGPRRTAVEKVIARRRREARVRLEASSAAGR
jgi:GNAT superfamily N-acetyltransferase